MFLLLLAALHELVVMEQRGCGSVREGRCLCCHVGRLEVCPQRNGGLAVVKVREEPHWDCRGRDWAGDGLALAPE